MRIAVTTPFSWPEVRRGGERYAHELAAALQAEGHDVMLWSTASARDDSPVLGVPTKRMGRRGWITGHWADQAVEVDFGARLVPRLSARPPDVWHANGIADAAAATLTAALRPRLRTVFTDHGFPVVASKAKRADAGLHRRVVAKIDSYVCVSPAAGEWLEHDFDRRADVVEPGVDLASYRPGSRDVRPTVVFSGQLDEPRKHLDHLLDAVDRLLDAEPQLQLWLLGQGDPSAVLAAAPDRVRRAVTRCGPAEEAELRDRYAAAWVTVLPSVAEAFGLVVVESLASGTPAVVRADSGGPAGIITSPDIGRVADGSVEGLAAAIAAGLRLAQLPTTTGACRAAAGHYDWRRGVVPRLERIYRGDD
jgi:phosphatidylinositol alpha-mannosyltransferase